MEIGVEQTIDHAGPSSSAMPPRCAGNAGIATKIDGSGSNWMGDVHLWFHGGHGGGKTRENEARSEGYLKLANLSAETTEEDVLALFKKYYNTLKSVKIETKGGRSKGFGHAVFGYKGERDKALIELNGTTLKGSALSLSKSDGPTAATSASGQAGRGGAAAAPGRKRARGPDGTLADEEIQAMLLEREAARSRRDYNAADAVLTELRANGILVDQAGATWRAADGRTGLLPKGLPAAMRPAGGPGGSKGGEVDEACTLYTSLTGDPSLGTNVLKRILAPFNVVDAHGMHGYARLTFEDALAASTAKGITHYSPTGRAFRCISAAEWREATGQPEPAAAAAAAQAAGSLPEGWSAGWSHEYGTLYYTEAATGRTQWEKPEPPAPLVEYEEEEEEEEAEAGGGRRRRGRRRSRPAGSTATRAARCRGPSPKRPS